VDSSLEPTRYHTHEEMMGAVWISFSMTFMPFLRVTCVILFAIYLHCIRPERSLHSPWHRPPRQVCGTVEGTGFQDTLNNQNVLRLHSSKSIRHSAQDADELFTNWLRIQINCIGVDYAIKWFDNFLQTSKGFVQLSLSQWNIHVHGQFDGYGGIHWNGQV